MGVFEKPRTPTPPAAAQKPAVKPPDFSSAISDTAKSLAESALERRPYLKMAFANPYNISLFGGLLAAAGITLNPVLALAACGAEALWLLHAPDSKRLRHLLWDPRFSKVKEALDAQERAQRLAGVSADERARVDTLVRKQRDIRAQAAKNPSFTGELLKNELVKTDRLVSAFVDMTVTCARYHEYLESVDLGALERDRRRYEAQVRNGKPDDAETDLARKNLAILLKRLEKMKEIRRYLTVAQGQLDLIENSFQLIQDQIVTMQS
ncbi:MAG TPA: hypothetical protein VKF32_00280, partial [Thermoanaerobaculia bacterium]|nr:hypothetical protein [Thermoanaerobaculia bacterium]